jgi:hypothetical protein
MLKFSAKKNKILKENKKSNGIFQNILIDEMKSSNLINYSTNT